MRTEQDEAARSLEQNEETLPDGSGGTIARTAPSTSGSTFAGGVFV